MSRGVLKLQGVSKRFRRGITHDSLRDMLTAGLDRLRGRSPRRREDSFWALKDISFEAHPGQALGVIGPNGAGKSTALKLMAGILRPDEGTIETRGRLSALIDVGAGFHGDLTGRENIYLNGAILGMRRREVDRKFDAIVAFSGIEEFIDTPVKRYSSGMQARLGFSVAAHVDPDILLIDEVLSVGDVVFRQRCLDRMRELIDQGVTLVFVTHNLEQMQAICKRAIVLNHGRVAFFGDRGEAVERYLSAMMTSENLLATGHPDSDGSIVTSLRFLDGEGHECISVRPEQSVTIEVRFALTHPVSRLVVATNMRRHLGEHFVNFNSERDGRTFDAPAGESAVRIDLPTLPVAGGHYYWNVRLWDSGSGVCLVDTPFRYPLVVEDGGRHTGMLCIERAWSPIESGVPDASEQRRTVGVST